MPEKLDSARDLHTLLFFCDESYRKIHPVLPYKLDESNTSSLIRLAKANKLSYHLAERVIGEGYSSLQVFHDVIAAGKSNFEEQERTLKFVSSVMLGVGDFLIIKSYKRLPYITVDIDFQVRPEAFEIAIEAMMAKGAYDTGRHHRVPLPGFLERLHDRARGASLTGSRLLEIDVYQDAMWSGWPCLDNDFVWRNPSRTIICGQECKIPDPGADLVLNFAHVIFNHGSIHLLDFMYMNWLLDQDMDFKNLFTEAQKYGWGRSLDSLVKVLRHVRQRLYEGPAASGPIRFPLRIPAGIIVGAYRGVAGATSESFASAVYNWTSATVKVVEIFIYR